MLKLYVNKIYDYGENGMYAVETNFTRIMENLQLIFSPSDISNLLTVANNQVIHYIHVIGHFIVLIEIESGSNNGKMIFFDPYNNIDTALDLYNKLTQGSVSPDIKTDFMIAFNEIKEDYDSRRESGVLLLVPPF